jgi:hypothetical protein
VTGSLPGDGGGDVVVVGLVTADLAEAAVESAGFGSDDVTLGI